jgi:hypothetical protein
MGGPMVENLAKDMPSMLGYEVRAALRRPLPPSAVCFRLILP